jgi:hypothetical protein
MLGFLDHFGRFTKWSYGHERNRQQREIFEHLVSVSARKTELPQAAQTPSAMAAILPAGGLQALSCQLLTAFPQVPPNHWPITRVCLEISRERMGEKFVSQPLAAAGAGDSIGFVASETAALTVSPGDSGILASCEPFAGANRQSKRMIFVSIGPVDRSQ